MCLVFIAYRTDGCAPVMIGANREESRRRPVTSPVCCRVRSLRCLLAGADHGPDGTFPEMGTWLGVNEAGLAVAVTNRNDGELAWEDQTRSRGLLAVNLLGFDQRRAGVAIRPGRAGPRRLRRLQLPHRRRGCGLRRPGPRRGASLGRRASRPGSTR